MIRISLDPSGLQRAAKIFRDRLEGHLIDGLEAGLERVAATAKLTTTFVDRTTALRNSIQSEGVQVLGDDLFGTVSFAARSDRGASRAKVGGRLQRGPVMESGSFGSQGYLYGLVQEYGRRDGTMPGKFFMRDAVAKEIEPSGLAMRAVNRAVAETLVEAGFEVEAAE